MGEARQHQDRTSRTRDIVLIALGIGVLAWCVQTGLTTSLKERLFDFRCFYDAAVAAGLLFVGLTFPPGIDALDGVGKAWRSMGGISWCLVAMVLILLAALVRVRGARPRA
jgi:hypothetical protein